MFASSARATRERRRQQRLPATNPMEEHQMITSKIGVWYGEYIRAYIPVNMIAMITSNASKIQPPTRREFLRVRYRSPRIGDDLNGRVYALRNVFHQG